MSLLAHATIDGLPLDDQRFHGYLELLVGGGNEALLAANPEGLAETATEEILRWVSPVIQFARTATVDTELGGQRIAARDTVVLWYPSANRQS